MAAKVVRVRDMLCDLKVIFLLSISALITCLGIFLICISIRCPNSFGVRFQNGSLVCGHTATGLTGPQGELDSYYGSRQETHSYDNNKGASMVTMVAKIVFIIFMVFVMACLTLVAAFKVAMRKRDDIERSSQFQANIQDAFDCSPIVKSDKVQLLDPNKSAV